MSGTATASGAATASGGTVAASGMATDKPKPPRARKPSGTAAKSPKKPAAGVIALTGATGFLGAYVAAALAAKGVKLRILAHRQPSHPLWRGLKVEIIPGSVLDPVACSRLVAGADAVVHAAGLIKTTREAAFTEINVEGTANLAQVVRDAGPNCRFVLISSLVVREPQLSAYAGSKWSGELAARAAFSGMKDRLTILRPPALYGPWDREGLPLFKATSGKYALVFGHGRVVMMHVQDAANAIAEVAMGAAAAGSYALSGPGFAAYSMRELVETAVLAIGGNPRIVTIPAFAVLMAGHISGWLARLRGKPEIFTAGKAREMLHPDWTVKESEALPLSVFRPSIGIREGFQETADWYKNEGWLGR
jgi:nucleoside-diphosphate-sugar epimerase